MTSGGDPNTSKALNRVYADTYSWRVEDITTGDYASVISQRVDNYTDPMIFFAWAAVLEGAHGVTDAATIKISLRDLTVGEHYPATRSHWKQLQAEYPRVRLRADWP